MDLGEREYEPRRAGDTMSKELLPCPFCGGAANLHCDADKETLGAESRYWLVECRQCGAYPRTYNTREVVVTRWNRRPATERLERIEHAAWHALDDGEEREGGIFLQAASYRRLSRLLPEEHP